MANAKSRLSLGNHYQSGGAGMCRPICFHLILREQIARRGVLFVIIMSFTVLIMTSCPSTLLAKTKARVRQAGNIIFLILLAVVMFAALPYAVTQGMRGGGKNGESESASLIASDILSYASLIENEANRLLLVNRIQSNNINLGHEFYRWMVSGVPQPTLRGQNPNCVSSSVPECDLFSYYGGSLNAREFTQYAQTGSGYNNGTPVPGQVQFRYQGILNVGTPAPEILLTIFGLNKDVCDAINDSLGLPRADIAGLATQGGVIIGSRDYWIEPSSEPTNGEYYLPYNVTAYIARSTFCYKNNFYGYIFVHSIITR